MKCANCDNEALYVYDTVGSNDVLYCASCLPGFLRPALKAGVLTTTASYQARQAEVLALLAPKPEPVVVEEPVVEPVVEETPVEEPVVEEPAPAPKRSRRKVTEESE